ncbi:DNA polymerase sigma subunit [Rhodotorula toruloides]|uniref:polynucleotide adenylyltransferase n=1 Tax=Rhodotorula toruloides TaxID=5286 RepID=A0A511KKP5_RHOTO|nr:DNA polymerase sigma subunit [Rhodotorula toruloides]
MSSVQSLSSGGAPSTSSLANSEGPSPASTSAEGMPKPRQRTIVTCLLRSQLNAANKEAATPKGKGPAKTEGPPDLASRAQFEGQEDFISFEASPSPPPQTGSAGGRGRPRDGVPGSRRRGGKRKLDEVDEEELEESSRRLMDREKARSTPWCEDPGVNWRKYDTSIDQFNAECRAFVTYISPTPIEHQLRLWTIELIRRTIKSKYPDADVQCFGSVGTGLYLPGGDIDLVVLSSSMPSPPLKPSSSLLHRLASLLLTSSIAAPQSLVVIAKARVPIVKFVTRYGGFSVDLSVNQKNGVAAAVRVRSMLEEYAFREEGYVEPGMADIGESSKGTSALQGKGKQRASPGGGEGENEDSHEDEDEEGQLSGGAEPHSVDHGVARSMVLLVKAFLAQRGMNEVFTGGLGSYSIICMVISFLQLHPKIQTATINPNRNLGLLFVEFLELYGKHFNYDQAGITLRWRGGYFNKHDKGWFRPQQPYLLSIEDPNDPQNDVSGGSHAILRVRQTLAGGFDTLAAWLIQRHSLLASRTNPSLVALTASALPNADSDPPSRMSQSLLGSVIGLSKHDADARDANVRLWQDGVLQRLLDRTDPNKSAGAGLSKKGMKKMQQEARDREKRERTIARLERKIEEKEKKTTRRQEKKAARKAEKAAAEGSDILTIQPLVDRSAIEDAKAKEAALEALAPHAMEQDDEADTSMHEAGFVIDTTGSRSAAVSNDEESDSRYLLGVPSVATTSTSSRNVYTHVTDDSSASEDEHRSDGDVVLGGFGGDFVRHDGSVQASRATSKTASSVDSDEVVEALIVPPAKRAKKFASEDDGQAKKKKKKQSSQDKANARVAYWGAKGRKETGSDSE